MANKEKVLVFGLNGLVGTVLSRQLEHSYELVGLSRRSSGTDITNITSVQEAVNQHNNAIAVINLAAATDTVLATSDPTYRLQCQQLNHQGALNVARVCADKGLYGVQVSTDYVYDGLGSGEILETDPLNPIEPYGASKALGEIAALDLGMAVATLAFPYTANPSRPDFVSKIVGSLVGGRKVFSFDNRYFTPTRTEDFIRGVDQMIKSRLSGKFHLVGSSYETHYSVGLAIAAAINANPELIVRSDVHEYNRQAAEKSQRQFQPRLKLSNEKWTNSTGIIPRTFLEGIGYLSVSSGNSF